MENIRIIMDRPVGYVDSFGTEYPINYGYVPEIMGGDGEEQDVYVLDIDVPLKEHTGTIIAIVKRADDVEEKWVMAEKSHTVESIYAQISFIEQYFDSTIQLL